jgi:hypothetical protein
MQSAWCKAVGTGAKGPDLTSPGSGRTGRRAGGSRSCPSVASAAASRRQLRRNAGGRPAAASVELLSAFAAAASEKHAEIKASLQPPLEHDGVLAIARACLVLLEAVIPKLARLAHFADTLSGSAGWGFGGGRRGASGGN